MYPPVTQHFPFLPALDPMSIACDALPHTSTYRISKESTMFAETRPNTTKKVVNCFAFFEDYLIFQ
jgi:hypothetical protein